MPRAGNFDAVVLIGETKEQEPAEYIRAEMRKPVAAHIVGATPAPGKRMGHTGAIIAGTAASAEEKVAVLLGAGAEIIPSPADIGTVGREIVVALSQTATLQFSLVATAQHCAARLQGRAQRGLAAATSQSRPHIP